MSRPTTADSQALPPAESRRRASRARWQAGAARTTAKCVTPLRIELLPPFERVTGTLELDVVLEATPVDLVLDWRGETADHALHDLRVNGKPLDPIPYARDHVVVPREHLRPGANRIEIALRCASASGRRRADPISRRDDGSEYVYSLLVPADASTVFPCFDQPDLKARFTLELTVPEQWRAVSNGRELARTERADALRATGSHRPSRSAPTCSRLPPGRSPSCATATAICACWCGARRLERAREEAGELFRPAPGGVAAGWSATSGSPSRTGSTTSCWCRSSPTAAWSTPAPSSCARTVGAVPVRAERRRPAAPRAAPFPRDLAPVVRRPRDHALVRRPVAQGGLRQLHGGEGGRGPRCRSTRPGTRFTRSRRRPTAPTRRAGTTPIWQALPNLNAAKSAYGSIVYSKAPAILRQLEFYLGRGRIRAPACGRSCAAHAHGAADWGDLSGRVRAASRRKPRRNGRAPG